MWLTCFANFLQDAGNPLKDAFNQDAGFECAAQEQKPEEINFRTEKLVPCLWAIQKKN
jgi:hypothetical protein